MDGPTHLYGLQKISSVFLLALEVMLSVTLCTKIHTLPSSITASATNPVTFKRKLY